MLTNLIQNICNYYILIEMNIAVILAGGSGTRIGAGKPKQFIEILGKPIIAYTLERFQQNANVDAIEVVCIPSHKEEIKSIVEQYGISKVRWYTDGGATFQESTMNGIYHLRGKVDRDDVLLLHFAVSPLTSDEIIDDAIRVAKEKGNAFPADEMIMCTCIKDTPDSSHTEILRETIVGLNGPWTFKYGDVLSVYEECERRGMLNTLDPHTSALYFALGKTIYFSKSATNNIKITRKEDLDMFEGYLMLQEKRKQSINK